MNLPKCLLEYDFTLALTGIEDLTDDVANALFESGCDDGTPAFRSGRVFITFSRQAVSLREAILSAISQVRSANIGADVLRVDNCNLVTQSDIARRIGRSRQLVHQYRTGERGPGGFPGPACEITEESPLWYWCEVACWLWQNDMIKEEVLREAQDIDTINVVLEMGHKRQVMPEILEEVVREIANDLLHFGGCRE